jgi:hypothetical protein
LLHRAGENAESLPRRAKVVCADAGIQRHPAHLDFNRTDLINRLAHSAGGIRQSSASLTKGDHDENYD